MDANQPSLRTQAVRGSIYLTFRQAFSVVLGVVGLLFMTRIVGPEGYGLYAAAFGVYKYFMLFTENGVKVYLLRARTDTPIEIFHQAFYWLFFASLGLALIAAILLGGVVLLRSQDFVLIGTLLALCLNFPLAMAMQVPLTLLERDLDYRSIAVIEVVSQVLYYGVGIVLALWGYGVWSFVGAFWAGQMVLFAGAFWRSRYRPRWLWNRALVRTILRESAVLAAAAFVYELRLLLPSVVLLPLAGAQAVGHYSIAHRLLITLGFIRDAVARLSVPLYAKAQDDTAKLLSLARRSAQAQMLGLFALYFPFILAGDKVLTMIFGGKWDTTLILVALAILAVNQLFFVVFGAQNQILIVLRLSRLFLWAGALYVLFSAVLGYIAIPLLPEAQKVLAFCAAISVAYIPSYYLIMHLGTKRYLGKTDYGVNLLWAGCLGIALLTPLLGYYAMIALAIFLLPQSRRQMREMVDLITQSRNARQTDASQSMVQFSMMRVQANESNLHEEHSRRVSGLSKAAIVALFIWFTIISLLITGYQHLYGSNHAYQLVLVQKLNDSTLYPNDPFADTVYHYASAFWYVIAWLSRFVDLSVVLFVFFLLNKPLFLLAGFRLARTFFPDSRYAPVVGMATMATFPQLLFGGGYVTDYTQQSSLSIATMLLALDAFLNKRWLSFAIWFGLAVNLNLMFSIFGASYVGVSWLIHLHRSYSADLLARTVASILGGLIVGAPGIYLVRRATTHAEYDPVSVWQACELSYSYHFYPQLWELSKQLLALLLVIGIIVAVYRFRNASPVGLHGAAWTGVAIGWYLVGWLNPLLLHSLPLLHLHPVRALVLWQLATVVFLTAFVLRIVENADSKSNLKYLTVYFLLIVALTFIDEFPPSLLLIGVSTVSIIVCEIGRRILSQRIAGSEAAVLAALVISFVSLYAVGSSFRSMLKGNNILAAVQHPATQVAEWARSSTPKEAVFLIPIHDEGGWQRFRHLSQRNVFTQRKDGTAWTYAPWFADDWLERLRALGFFEVLGIDEKSFRIGSWIRIWSDDEKNFILAYDKVDDDRVEALRQQYRIDYWITRANVKTRFPKVYEHEGWKVLKVSE